MVRKDLVDLYEWIRKNNQHTPDDVVDFMYNAAIEKFDGIIEKEEEIKVEIEMFRDHKLYDADPNCEHEIICADSGGLKCRKCTGWFCL